VSIDTLKQKFILGTVQLGLPYGINNSAGQPDLQEAFKILNTASEHGIQLLDTAEAYGKALSILSDYQAQPNAYRFKIISKFKEDGVSLSEKLDRTLSSLQMPSLHGYLFHRFDEYQSGKFKDVLNKAKDAGKIQHIGVSLYGVDELKIALADNDITLIQLPINPFDNSPEKKDLLQEAHALGKQIHVRSVFLQGLLFKTPDQLTGNLKQLYTALQSFQNVLTKYKLNARQVCLNYALHQTGVDGVVIGVETSTQLRENMSSVMPHFSKDIAHDLESIDIPDRFVLNPSNWRP
jgi:aryl-alcohol dehydrogenase-like predicted oxidoreductase